MAATNTRRRRLTKPETKIKTVSDATAPYPMNPRVRIVMNGKRAVTAHQHMAFTNDRLRHASQQPKARPATASCCPVETMAVAEGIAPTPTDNNAYDTAP